jgi:hypothetical protein
MARLDSLLGVWSGKDSDTTNLVLELSTMNGSLACHLVSQVDGMSFLYRGQGEITGDGFQASVRDGERVLRLVGRIGTLDRLALGLYPRDLAQAWSAFLTRVAIPFGDEADRRAWETLSGLWVGQAGEYTVMLDVIITALSIEGVARVTRAGVTHAFPIERGTVELLDTAHGPSRWIQIWISPTTLPEIGTYWALSHVFDWLCLATLDGERGVFGEDSLIQLRRPEL